jgi:magnesium-transporting ATPase (P-type)
MTHFFKKKNMKQPDNQGECRISLNILRDCGYNPGLCRLLNTNAQTGIIGDRRDLERRVALFGKHSIALPTIESFLTLLARQFEDNNVIFLIWAATIYLGIAIFNPGKRSYIQPLTIYGGLIFAALMSAICDYIKELQFLKLKDEINNQTVVVYRGAHGTCHSIPIRELVVGDLVDVQQGDRVPADCLLIEEMNIKVDQSMYYPGDTSVEKEQSSWEQTPDGDWQDNHREHPDPFLLSDSKIMTG